MTAILLAAGVASVPTPTLAEGATATGVADGAAIALHGVTKDGAPCSACHMPDGAGQPEVGIPRLAGLAPSYIAAQLDYFADGARDNLVMKPYAAALTAAQRAAVARYFAGLPTPVAADPSVPSVAMLARGHTLFADGDARIGLVGCSQCHGPTGLGVGDFSPRLVGQSAVYVVEQLQGWHTGGLRDPKGVYMKAIAARLSPEDMRAAAAYISTMNTATMNTATPTTEPRP